ncbi:MAG: hypothetical protein JST32_17605, partial [Bacteroidetes bacterium]|nr:hypothetical protein [Bacteroidota bacterium]
IKSAKINNIYRELKDDLVLDGTPSATPNAAGVLFRVFLEVSLDYYASKVLGKNFGRDENINQKISAVTQFMETNTIATSRQLTAIRTVSSSQSKDILHIDRFHEYVHSATIHPDPASLKAKWDNLQDFFGILWGDLEKRNK